MSQAGCWRKFRQPETFRKIMKKYWIITAVYSILYTGNVNLYMYRYVNERFEDVRV